MHKLVIIHSFLMHVYDVQYKHPRIIRIQKPGKEKQLQHNYANQTRTYANTNNLHNKHEYWGCHVSKTIKNTILTNVLNQQDTLVALQALTKYLEMEYKLYEHTSVDADVVVTLSEVSKISFRINNPFFVGSVAVNVG